MQQLDQRSGACKWGAIPISHTILTFVLLDYPADLLKSCLQLAADAVCHIVNVGEQLALLLELAAHVVGLLAQIAHGAEDAVKLLVLLVHHLHLSLLLESCVAVLLFERVWVWQHIPIHGALGFALGVVDSSQELLTHALDLFAVSNFSSMALGAEYKALYLACKNQELAEFRARVTDVEYDAFIKTV